MTAARGGALLLEILWAMRPHQWVKNLFVLTPLIFARQLTQWDKVGLALVALVLFCALSGAVYLLNDIFDRERDRLHPVKRLRPIASGKLPVRAAVIALVVVLVTVLGVSVVIDLRLTAVAAGYFGLNVAYSMLLKRIVFVDLIVISAGFILRILAGAVAVAVPVSVWLVLCTFLLAMFLGMGKRKHELVTSGDDAAKRRSVLVYYKLAHLNMALNLTSAVTTLVYLLYTTSERTISEFGTKNLLFTVPFIVFGLVRYMQILETHRDSESPTDYITKDIPFIVNLGLWGAVVTLIIYVF